VHTIILDWSSEACARVERRPLNLLIIIIMCIAMFLLSPPAYCICFIESILGLFCRYWCLKEAFVKAIGAGLGFGLQRLEFHHSNWTNISVYIDGVKSRDWRFSLFELGKGHWVSALHLFSFPL